MKDFLLRPLETIYAWMQTMPDGVGAVLIACGVAVLQWVLVICIALVTMAVLMMLLGPLYDLWERRRFKGKIRRSHRKHVRSAK